MKEEYKSKKFNGLKSRSNQINDLNYELEFKNKILDFIIDPVFVHDLKGNLIYANEACCNYFNYSPEELIGKNIQDLNIREFNEFLKPKLQELFKNGEFKFQYKLKGIFGALVEINSKIIESNGKKLIFSILHDLAERGRIEKLIRNREEHLSLITNNMLDLIYQVDRLGCFQYVSPSIKDLLGYNPEDIMGKQDLELISIVHPDDLGLLIDTVQTCIVTLKPGRAQHRFKHVNGHYIWVETIGNPIIDKNGEFAGAVYITRDITELKHVENQLKSSLSEKELLLREVHHRVKNNMQIISSILNLQSAYLEDKIALNTLRESQNRVKSMAIVHEELYQSDDLSKIDFTEYIKRLVAELFNSYGINQQIITLKINAENIFLDIDTAIHCGLIINELVSNSLKHAFPTTSGRGPTHNKFTDPAAFSCGPTDEKSVDLATENREFENRKFLDPATKSCELANGSFEGPEDKDQLTKYQYNGQNFKNGKIGIKFYLDDTRHILLIEDNGIGFPENINPQNTKTLGLKLVYTLVTQLSGEIMLNTENGSSFKIIF